LEKSAMTRRHRQHARRVRYPDLQRTPHEKRRLSPVTQRIIVDGAILVTCDCFALRELRAGGHPSC
jgi:hypothetical protein